MVGHHLKPDREFALANTVRLTKHFGAFDCAMSASVLVSEIVFGGMVRRSVGQTNHRQPAWLELFQLIHFGGVFERRARS